MMSEFLALLCNLYILGLTVALPLYTDGTWWRLGDAKYGLFRNLSVFCLAVWAFSALISGIRCLIGRFGLWEGTGIEQCGTGGSSGATHESLRNQRPRSKLTGYQSCGAASCGVFDPRGIRQMDADASAWLIARGNKLSIMDALMFLYGGCVLCSALVSAWPETAWTGYREWYMGAFSQLLFVGIYFFVSRHYTEKKYVVRLWEAAFFLVLLFGFFQRLGLDPLGLTKDFEKTDWEYSHMLSTVGNINWFCGYCAMAMALPLSGYLESRDKWERRLLYTVSVLGLFFLLIQGSDSGVFLGATALGICFLWGLKDEGVFRRTCGLAAGVCILIPAYGNLARLIGDRAVLAFPQDGVGLTQLLRPGWWIAGAGFLLLWLICRILAGKDHGIRSGNSGGNFLRTISFITVLLFCLGGIVIGLEYLMRQPAGALWGNGRGMLWKVSWKGCLQNGGLQKLLGVGPDCFAEYIYSSFSSAELPALEGMWKDAVFANAHNEWLNQLVNLGIMGTGVYLGIFLAGVRRYRHRLVGVLAIVLYLAASLTGFQQVLSTPFLFLLLGLCESAERVKEEVHI